MKALSNQIIAGMVLLAITLAGCGSANKTPAAAPKASSPQETATVTRTLSEAESKETEALARQIETSVNANDTTVYQKVLNLSAMAEKACAGLGLSAADKASLIKGMNSGGSGFASMICKAVQNNGSYTLLRMRVIDDQPHALFRMLSNGAVNYHELRLAKRDGAYAVEDAFIYMTGEWLSQTLRRGVLPLAAHNNRGVLDKLMRNENAYMKNFQSISQMQRLIQQGKGAEALRIYATLPAEIHSDRNIQITHITASQQAGDAEYAKALEEFQKFFPDAAWADLILIDAFFLTKQYAKSQDAVSRLDRSLGGDPYLDVLRAGIYKLSGENEKAKAAAQQAIASKLDMQEPYLLMVEFAAKEKAFAEGVTWLTKLNAAIKTPAYNLEGIPEFEALLQSPEYKKFIAESEAKGK